MGLFNQRLPQPPVQPLTPQRSNLWVPQSYVPQPQPVQQPAGPEYVAMKLIVTAAASKGGNLRGSHGEELARGVLVCSATKLLHGQVKTLDHDDKPVLWDSAEVVGSTVVIALDESDIDELEQEFSEPRYKRGQGGRAMEFVVAIAADSFSVGQTGNFNCTVLEIDSNSFSVPTAAAVSADEQKQLVASKRAVNSAVRTERLKKAREAREQASTAAEAGLTEAPPEPAVSNAAAATKRRGRKPAAADIV